MATAGGATANTSATTTATASASSYGGDGGGAGGKFRKKPLRRQTTPYDRPLTVLHGSSRKSTSWLSKLVVDPASKLISYGAQRFFASVFRKRLPPPLPQPPEEVQDLSGGLQAAVPDAEKGSQEQGGDECNQQVNISRDNGMSELEQLLKQRTFTKSEIEHLTALVHSRSVEASIVHGRSTKEQTVSHFGKHQEFPSGSLAEHRNEMTPVVNRKVPEEVIASPAELAKAYMGGRPSKVSQSTVRSQVAREENIMPASESSILPLANRTLFTPSALENGIITPKSVGRSGIFNSVRNPYSRIHPTSTLKNQGTGIAINGYPGTLMSSSRSLLEHDENYDSKPMTLKRRSSVLDEEIGFVGSVRRIRQKPNLLAPRVPHTSLEIGSHSGAKQKLPMIDERKHNALVTVGEKENESVPSTSYARNRPKSSEVAARILQHLETLTPTEKSTVYKSAAAREKSPFKLTPKMLRGRALRSLEDMDSSKLLSDERDVAKLENRSNATFPNAADSTFQKSEKVKENGPKESGGLSDTRSPVSQENSVSSLEPSGKNLTMVDSVVANSTAQPQKRAFRMSALEDSAEQDDDMHCNGLAPQTLFEERGSIEFSFMGQKRQAAEEPNPVEATIQRELQSASGLVSSKPEGIVSPGAVKVGEGSSAAAKTVIPPLSSIASLDAAKASEHPAAFGLNSEVADKRPFLLLESSSKKLESISGSYSRLVSDSSPAGSQVTISEPDASVQVNPSKVGDGNGTSNTVPSVASNGPLATIIPSISFPAAPYKDTARISTGSATHSTFPSGIPNATPPNTSTGSFGTSTGVIPGSTVASSTTAGPLFKFGAVTDQSTGVIPGSTVASSTTAGPLFKFGAVTDQSTAVSATATAKISESANLVTKDEFCLCSGSSGSANSSVAAFVSPSTVYSTITPAASSDNSLVTANKPVVSGAGAQSPGTSNQSASVVPFPSVSMNGSTGFNSTLSNSQVFNLSKSSDISMPAPSPAPSSVFSSSGAASSAASIGETPAPTPVNFSSNASPGTFSFGLSSSSTSTNAAGSSNSGVFGFTSSSLASSQAVNSSSSFNCGTSGIFGFSAKSSTSTPATNPFDSSNASVNPFSSTWEAPKSSGFSSLTNFSSPSTGFSFSASSTSAPNSTASMVFNASTGASSVPGFSFTAAATSVSSSPSPSFIQQTFGNPSLSFPVSSGNNYHHTNAEDSMAEDTEPSSAPFPGSAFGQPAASPPSVFSFGSTPSQQPSPFSFGGQPAQVAPSNPSLFGGQQPLVAPPNPSPFNSSGSLDFAPGGGFSLGSGDKSGRKIVRVNRNNKNRRK